jgi:hypothetical protein
LTKAGRRPIGGDIKHKLELTIASTDFVERDPIRSGDRVLPTRAAVNFAALK